MRGYGMLLKMFIGLQIFDLKEYKRSCRKVANQKEVKVKTVFQIALTFLLLSVPARAQEFEYGTSTVCDTQQQMERYVALLGGNTQTAIDAVNAEEHDPTACALATVSYVRGPQLETVRNKDSAFQIVRILVVGVGMADSVHPVKPAAFFTVFGIREYSV
jgi:hypothetical protein